MDLPKTEKRLERRYHISIYIIAYKMAFGFFELASGIFIRVFGRRLDQFYSVRLARELAEDPHDLLARLSEKIVPNILTHNGYLAIYLVLLGGAKIAGAVGLVYGENWGVDLLVGLTAAMFPFQLGRLIIHPTVFDAVYAGTGVFISLYLIEFKPKAWVSRLFIKNKGKRS
ncbi:MAG TPA: DUF2127 domain-containing protein [Candidatus Sulfotelmatobacter sp.]|nr:DUF2127 domain-containing protein [Candidatus Sulfotelmatobacter sp.]